MPRQRITVGLKTNGLKELAADLKTISPKVAAELQTSLRMAGDLVAASAKSEAEWSTRIPATIKTSVTGRAVTVKAGGADAPHAYTFEAPTGTPVRHPVFGHRGTWVEQAPRPFLRPALDDHTDELAELLVAAIDRALLRSGFH